MYEFERGFKSWAERIALGIRGELDLAASDPLDVHRLASLLEIRLLTPEDVANLPKECLDQLLLRDPMGWSAVSVYLRQDAMVIFNPTHSLGRQASDIAHELAHYILDHKPATIIMSQDGDMAMRTYDERQEHEANWLAACLLLPRPALLLCKRQGLSKMEASERYGVSQRLFTFRMGVTGVERQWRAGKRKRS